MKTPTGLTDSDTSTTDGEHLGSLPRSCLLSNAPLLHGKQFTCGDTAVGQLLNAGVVLDGDAVVTANPLVNRVLTHTNRRGKSPFGTRTKLEQFALKIRNARARRIKGFEDLDSCLNGMSGCAHVSSSKDMEIKGGASFDSKKRRLLFVNSLGVYRSEMAKKHDYDPIRKAKMTPAASRAAKRLHEFWRGIESSKRPRQQQLADEYMARFGRGSQVSIGQYLRGEIPLNWRALSFFAEKLGANPAEIYPELPEVQAMKHTRVESVRNADGISIRRFDVQASMGTGVAQVEGTETILGAVTVARDWIRNELRAISKPENLAILTGYGDSMEGTFSDGAQLIVDRGVHEVRIDSIYVLALNDELYVKRLQRRPNGSILMISDNRKYDPYLIQDSELEKFKVLGRVVGVWNFTKI